MEEIKYYIIKPAVDTHETGSAYPAVESFDDYDFNAPNSVHKLTFREFPDFEPDIRFKLKLGAKLTDMLNQATISAHGFLVSDKLKDAFSHLSIVPHKFYPAYIEDTQGAVHNYYWMHIAYSADNIIWKQSSFIAKRFSKIIEEPILHSFEEYHNKSIELGGKIKIVPNKLTVRDNHNLFTIPLGIDIYTDTKGFTSLRNSATGLNFELDPRISL